jgi:hypothetical protein
MSRKNVLKSYKMLDAADISANASSPETSVINTDKASIHVVWSGSSPVGTLVVQAKNGEFDSWYTLDFGSAISISGSSGEHSIVLNETPFERIKLVYTATSGTGTLNAVITMKTTGA